MSRSFLLPIVAASTVIDAFVFLRSFLAKQENAERIDLKTLARAIGATSVAFVLKLFPLMVMGLTIFGLIHLVHVDLVVLAPALATFVLLARWKQTTPSVRAIAIAWIFPAFVGAYAGFVEPFDLRLETAEVVVSPKRIGARPITVGLLADIQTQGVSAHERNAVARLKKQKPDLVLIAGDVFQGDDDAFERALPGLRALFAELKPPGGVFVVPGDVDVPVERVARLGEHVRPLINEIVRIEIGDRRVALCGIELNWTSAAARAAIDRLENDPGNDDLRILLAHRPDAIYHLSPNSRIDLVVSGHTHGGQVVIPGFGPPFTLSSVPRSVAAGGLHRIAGNAIYVSRGVGCERAQAPRLRLFCPPEISLLTIR